MKKMNAIAAAIVLLAFITAFYAYPLMPGKVASHWGMNGEVNGYMERGFGVFLMPVLSLFMLVLFFILPKIDPMGKNYSAFRGEYDAFIALIIAFMYYVYLLTLAINLGYAINIMQFMAPAFAILFFYAGVLVGKAKQNWFVGIRTPWTLSSKKVWGKTHALGGKMFKAAAVIALLGIFMPEMFMASVIVMLVGALGTVVYSYFEFRKEK